VNNISIVGFGDIFKGDLGIGCYLIDVLCQEPLGEAVELAYVGENLHYTGAYLCEMDFAVIAGGLDMGGGAGMIHCWDMPTFEHNAFWLGENSVSMRLLARTLTGMRLSGFLPADLLLLLMEPDLTEGFGMSPMMHKVLRKAVHIIKEHLFRRGLLPETAYRLASIHQLEALCTTV